MPPPTDYTSGMSNSFRQATPGAAPPVSPKTPVVGAVPPVAQQTFSKPAVPAAPATGTTTAKPTTAPGTQAPKPQPFSMKMDLPSMASTAGSLISAGSGAYNSVTSPGALGALKTYLGQPQNFANILGALSPIAGPILQNGGLPLMLGAYSMLRDPSYAKDLTGGMLPKLGVANPFAAPSSLTFRTPDIIGSGHMGGPTFNPSAATASLPQITKQDMPDPTAAPLDSKIRMGMGLTGAGASILKPKMAPGLGIATDLADLTGIPEMMAGKQPGALADKFDQHAHDLNGANWAQGYSNIYNNPQYGATMKALHMLGHTIANPAVNASSSPLSTVGALGRSIGDLGDSLSTMWQLQRPGYTGVAGRVR